MKDVVNNYPKDKVQILSVNTINREGKVESDAKRFGLTFPVLIGRGSKIIDQYNISNLPILIIIDMEGKIVLKEGFVGADLLKKTLDKLIKS